jgi:hypothetical protein
VCLLQRNGKDGAVLVFDLEFLAFLLLGDALEFPDAVFVMDDKVAGLDVIKGGAGADDTGFFH